MRVFLSSGNKDWMPMLLVRDANVLRFPLLMQVRRGVRRVRRLVNLVHGGKCQRASRVGADACVLGPICCTPTELHDRCSSNGSVLVGACTTNTASTA